MSWIVAVVSAAVTVLVAFLVGALVDNLALPIVELFTNLAVDPLSVPIVNQVILWTSLCAATVCALVRVLRGMRIYLEQDGRPGEFGRWAVKTVLSVACVAMMPLFCNIIVKLGSLMFKDVQEGVLATGAVTISSQPMSNEFLEGLADLASTGDVASIGGTLANCVLVVLVLAAIVMVTYQLFKRQVILLFVTAISCWVAVKSSMDSSDDVVDMLVSMFGLVVTQWLQYMAMAIGIAMLNAFLGDVSWIAVDITADGAIQSYILVLAFLGAALAIPQVVERYAFSAGRGGAGNMVVGMMVRGGIGSIGKAGRAAGGLAGKAGGR